MANCTYYHTPGRTPDHGGWVADGETFLVAIRTGSVLVVTFLNFYIRQSQFVELVAATEENISVKQVSTHPSHPDVHVHSRTQNSRTTTSHTSQIHTHTHTHHFTQNMVNMSRRLTHVEDQLSTHSRGASQTEPLAADDESSQERSYSGASAASASSETLTLTRKYTRSQSPPPSLQTSSKAEAANRSTSTLNNKSQRSFVEDIEEHADEWTGLGADAADVKLEIAGGGGGGGGKVEIAPGAEKV
jgi:hypothetical protein